VSRPSEEDRRLLGGRDVAEAGLTDWVLLTGVLHARFRTPDYATGLSLVAQIGAAAVAADHHPDLALRYAELDVHLVSHDVGGVTARDLRLAREISVAAARAGARPTSVGLAVVELALDTSEVDAVRPFWAAVLGYTDDDGAPYGGPDEVRDPHGTGPSLWFQEAGPDPVPPAQRFHLDVWVDPEAVQPRMRAALAAGGTLHSDAEAPAYWVLADPQGNKACLCTWQAR
jgi:4a-hydroxytetrahydrobiopterin dehydratase